MSKFRGYAQESRTGFDPIKAPDTSRRILEQAEQTIRGLQAVRDADVANTAAYLQSFNQAQEAERQSLSNYGRLMNVNFEVRKTNLDNQARAAAERKRLAGANREAIFKNLAQFSKTAAGAFVAYRKQKFDDDYNNELTRLYTQQLSDSEDAQNYLTDFQDSKNLDIIGVGHQGQAAAAEEAGVDSFRVAQIRQKDAGISMGAKAARAKYYASQYAPFIQKAISSDKETKVKIINPDGSLRDGVPTDATDSKNVAFVAQQLLPGYLKQKGMHGLKSSFLVPALQTMRQGTDRIVASMMENEIAGQRQKQVDDISTKFQSKVVPPSQSFHEAHARLQFLLGGQQQSRKYLFGLMETPQQVVEGATVGFSDVEVSQILQSSFPDQPNKTIAERYPQEVLKLKEQRQQRQYNRATAEDRAEDLAIRQDYDRNLQTLIQDVTEGDGRIDLSDENIDLIVAEYRKLGPKYNEHVKLYESFRQFTDEAVDAKPHIERYEEAIKFGMATPEEIMLNTSIPYEQRVGLAKKAQETDKNRPSETEANKAEAHITAYLRDRAKANGSKTIHRSLRVMTQYGIERFRTDYIQARRDGFTDTQAYKEAIGTFNKEYDKGKDGEYAIDNDYKGENFTSGRFKKFELYQGKTSTPEITARQISDAIKNDPNAISTPLVDIDPLKKVRGQLVTGQKPAKVPQIEMIQRLAKKPGGGTYSYSEVLLSQMEAHGLKKTDRIEAAIEAESQIPPRYQILRNYPSPVNTDVMLMSSGVAPVYNRYYKVTPLQERALAVLGKYESDGAGSYNAMNEGGADGGRTVVGRSGPSKEIIGRNLTEMTVAEVIQMQQQGLIHAAGRYQFIGNTLPGVVQDAGVPLDALFNERTQDFLGLTLMRDRGISPWIGPSDRATSQERQLIEQARQQPISFGDSPWQQSQNMNPNLVERLSNFN